MHAQEQNGALRFASLKSLLMSNNDSILQP
jgi:hypothetical protein